MAGFLIVVAIGIVIFGGAVWAVRMLAIPLPPEPDVDDVVEVSVDYRCIVCGLRLTVTHVHEEELEAPKHCREEMLEG